MLLRAVRACIPKEDARVTASTPSRPLTKRNSARMPPELNPSTRASHDRTPANGADAVRLLPICTPSPVSNPATFRRDFLLPPAEKAQSPFITPLLVHQNNVYTEILPEIPRRFAVNRDHPSPLGKTEGNNLSKVKTGHKEMFGHQKQTTEMHTVSQLVE